MPKVLNKHHLGYIPKGAVYIGRNRKHEPENPFANLYEMPKDGNREQVCEKYRVWLLEQPELIAKIKRELRGKDLVCFCAPQQCHGDLLLEIANSEAQERREAIARQATVAGDLMTVFNHDRMPVL